MSISAMLGLLSSSLNAAASVVPRSRECPGQQTRDNRDEHDVDGYREFSDERQFAGDRDSRQKGTVFHRENADELRNRFAARNQGPRADQHSGQPEGKFTRITGSFAAKTSGPARNSAAIANSSAISSDAGNIDGLGDFPSLVISPGKIRCKTHGIAITLEARVMLQAPTDRSNRGCIRAETADAVNEGDCTTKTGPLPAPDESRPSRRPQENQPRASALRLFIACGIQFSWLLSRSGRICSHHGGDGNDERCAEELADAEKSQFGEGRFNDHKINVKRNTLSRIDGTPANMATRNSVARPQGANKTFKNMQASTRNFICPPHFINAAPRAGVLQALRFVDHRQLEMPRRIVHRNFSSFSKDQHEKCDQQTGCEPERRTPPGSDPLLLHDIRNRRLGHKRNREKHNHKTGSARNPTIRVRLAPIGP